MAADESTGTIGKRFADISVENTHENRRAYRELLFKSEGIEEYISGVITYEETLFDTCSDGTKMVDVLRAKGIAVGIKVDAGPRVLRGTDGETYTQGFDNLADRCKKYYEAGARFAKWRAVIKMNKDTLPTELGIQENVRGLARYAAICQDNGLVPIVEPEVLVLDGDHTIERSVEVTQNVLAATFKALNDAHVLLEGALLKPNMVLPGKASGQELKPMDIAHATLTTLRRTLPPALVGVVFLSGGQSEEEASLNLSAINAIDLGRPWALTFSYGRALQASCLRAWQGKAENVKAAQDAFMARAKANSLAALGKYEGGEASAGGSLYVANYVY